MPAECRRSFVPYNTNVSIAGYYFLLYIGFLLPFLAYRSSKKIHSGQVIASRVRVYLSTLIQLVFLVALALFAAWRNYLPLFPHAIIGFREIGIGIAAFVLKIGYFFFRFFSGKHRGSRALQLIAPQTRNEKILYIWMALMAGVCEEIAYRGVGFQLFAWITNSYLAGALLSAVVFGLAHIVQGRSAVFAVILHALVDQLVVYLTGTLYIVMVIHFLYDAIVGLFLSKRIHSSSL
jgi:membrane protease YdiL (CAAX protease family)